jgi:hypothetical protein
MLDYGHTAVLSVAVSPASGMTVSVEGKTATSGWVQVATLMTDSSGAARLAVTPLVTTEYRVLTTDAGVASGVVRVGVRARATVKSSRRTVHRNRLVAMSGTVTTGARAMANAAMVATIEGVESTAVVSPQVVRAVLQRKVGHRWITVKRVFVNSAGRYLVRVRPHARRTYAYRIRVATSAANAASVSRIIRIRVR